MIYGIKKNTCGVYLITNKLTGEQYVGASVDIPSRLSTHFGRDAKKYPWRKFYQDITKLGRESFTWRVLEECSKEQLLEREQFWYDKLNPTYNFDRPVKYPSQSEQTMRSAHRGERVERAIELRKELYNTKAYKELFKSIQRKRFTPVSVFNLQGVKLADFESISECARWVDEVTDFKGKNKVSKIRSVCLGERPTAFGFVFKFSKTCNDYPERE